MSPGALGTLGHLGFTQVNEVFWRIPHRAQPLPQRHPFPCSLLSSLRITDSAPPTPSPCPVNTVSSWTGEGYEQHSTVFPLRPTTSVSPLSRVLALHHWRKLNRLVLLCPPQSSARCPLLHGLFQTTANFYLTVCLNSSPTAEIFSWPVHHDEDKNLSFNFKNEQSLSVLSVTSRTWVITSICWWTENGCQDPLAQLQFPERPVITFPSCSLLRFSTCVLRL